MAVLSDSDILELLGTGTLKIEGFQERNLTPNGYDVTIDEIAIPSTGEKVRDGTISVPSGAWFLIGTREYLELPPHLVGEIWIRTTWARKGILASFGRIDAGFHGNLTFSALNASGSPIALPIGERFAQVVLSELLSPPKKTYEQRSGNYQRQRGITLEPTNSR
ncbi:MAG: dCTP deaminase [Methanomassiliicoccales archaeon]|nr:dCTP deaminase [Methanomassiliicoccales archaeon]